MFRVLLAVIALSLFTPVWPAVSADDQGQAYLRKNDSASLLVREYMEIPDPDLQDLRRIFADPQKYRDAYGTAVLSMQDNVLQNRKYIYRAPDDAPLDPKENLKLFKLVEFLIQSQAPPPSAAQNKAWSGEEPGENKSDDKGLSLGLTLMVQTFELAHDPVSAHKYYNRLKALVSPDDLWPNFNLSTAAAALIQAYCESDNFLPAVELYQEYSRMEMQKKPGSMVFHWQPETNLIRAFAGNGQIDKALMYYAVLEENSSDEFIERHKMVAGQALADAYRKKGDFKSAEEWDGKIKVEEERFNEKKKKRDAIIAEHSKRPVENK